MRLIWCRTAINRAVEDGRFIARDKPGVARLADSHEGCRTGVAAVDSFRAIREHPLSVTAGELSRFCANHLDRSASSLCVRCRRAMCHECSTRWEGINYCVSCLAVQRQSVVRSTSRFGWLPLILAAVLLLASFAYAMVWMGALVMDLF